MTLPRLGHAIIVNNVASEMPGSNEDVKALKESYETVGFDVQVHNDCDAQVNTKTLTKSMCFIMNTLKHVRGCQMNFY